MDKKELKNECLENEQPKMPVIGDKAPSFTAVTTEGEINFPEDYKGKWAILFSHPADFTPVCTTEFMTFAKMADEFKELNTELIGLSIDSLFSHIAWLRKIRDIEWKDMKNINVEFPLIEDIKMDVSNAYGMVSPNHSSTQAVRAVYFVDPKGYIRTILYYPQEIGRNFDEIKRIIIALQKHDKDKVALPADWRPGEDVIVPPAGTFTLANERMEQDEEDINCLDWFMCFKKDK